MNDKAKNIIIIVLGIITLLCSFGFGYMFYKHNNEEHTEHIPIILRDTVYIDSIRIEEHTKLQYITKDRILYIYHTDSVTDTVYVEVPIEHKIYQDTIRNDSSMYDISICYSGWHSSIDEVNIASSFTRKVEVPILKERKFHISLLTGIGTMYDVVHNEVSIGPYVGIGASYTIW